MYMFLYKHDVYRHELEEDTAFLDEIGCLFDSRKTSTLFFPHRTKLFSDYNERTSDSSRRTSDSSSR